jgi:hypothetical protein
MQPGTTSRQLAPFGTSSAFIKNRNVPSGRRDRLTQLVLTDPSGNARRVCAEESAQDNDAMQIASNIKPVSKIKP